MESCSVPASAGVAGIICFFYETERVHEILRNLSKMGLVGPKPCVGYRGGRNLHGLQERSEDYLCVCAGGRLTNLLRPILLRGR